MDSASNLDTYINISNNRIELNSTNLTFLNKSAKLRMYNLTFTTPRILVDGTVCPATICTQESYTGGTLAFNVTGFSIYTSEETPVAASTSSGSSSSSGGGDGGGVSTLTDAIVVRVIRTDQIEEGYVMELSKDEALGFNFGNGTRHSLSLNDILGDRVKIAIESVPVRLELGLNQFARLSVEENGEKHDLYVELRKINNGSAEFFVQKIDLEISGNKGYLGSKLIKESVVSGEIGETSLMFANPTSEDLEFKVSHNLGELLEITEGEFSVPRYTEKSIALKFNALEEFGIFSGRVDVSFDSEEVEVPVVFEILDKEDPLLDVIVKVVNGKVRAGENLSLNVKMFNLRSEEGLDFDITYSVKDLQGLEVVNLKEGIVLEGEEDLSKKILLPLDILDGTYVVVVTRGESSTVSSDFFEVRGRSILERIVTLDFERNSLLKLLLLVIVFMIGLLLSKFRHKFFMSVSRIDSRISFIEKKLDGEISKGKIRKYIKLLEKHREGLWKSYRKGDVGIWDFRKRGSQISNLLSRLRRRLD
jgi:hypothetical protein